MCDFWHIILNMYSTCIHFHSWFQDKQRVHIGQIWWCIYVIFTPNLFACDKALDNCCMYFPMHCISSRYKLTGFVDTAVLGFWGVNFSPSVNIWVYRSTLFLFVCLVIFFLGGDTIQLLTRKSLRFTRFTGDQLHFISKWKQGKRTLKNPCGRIFKSVWSGIFLNTEVRNPVNNMRSIWIMNCYKSVTRTVLLCNVNQNWQRLPWFEITLRLFFLICFFFGGGGWGGGVIQNI